MRLERSWDYQHLTAGLSGKNQHLTSALNGKNHSGGGGPKQAPGGP